jgi:hypothetical protein
VDSRVKPPEITELPWYLLQPLDGITSMLELGNKKTPGQQPYKVAFERMGIRHVSVDLNGEDGALKRDLREPLNLGRFDMVTNFGTSEHVSEQEPVWRNMVEACGKVLVSMTPESGWERHGIWYPEPKFYEELARLNGFKIERMEHRTWKPRGTLCCVRMARLKELPFTMPDEALIRKVAPSDYFTKFYG